MRAIARFVAEARRRRVFRTGGLYILAAWVVVQATSLLLPALRQSEALLIYAWLAAVAGLPIALVFGWYYDIGAAGIRRTQTVRDAAAADPALHVPDYVIIGGLAIVAAIVAAGLFDRARQVGEELSFDTLGVAVLPLADLSEQGSEAYFSAGMQDALIASLSQIRALNVVSRRSTLAIDPALETRSVGELLGVRHLIEGSVARDRNRVRIIVQLVDAARDVQIWGGTFERELTGALGLQNDIARAIADAVEVRLSEHESGALARQPEMNAASYDDYLRAMYLIHGNSNIDRRKGIEILERAVVEDPGNALLHAGRAVGYAFLGHSPLPEGMYPASRAASAEALRLDDALAEAHLAVGMLKMYYERDFAAAENALIRALEINPNLAIANYHYAWLMELIDDDARALPPGEKSVRLDPLNPFMRGWLAEQYRDAGQFSRAVDLAKETLEIEPGHVVSLRVLALTYAELGDFTAALAASESIASDPLWGFTHGVILAKSGRRQEAIAVLEGIEATPRNVISLFRLNAVLGNDDAVFHWLDVARDVELPWYPWMITWFPDVRQYREDPRMLAHADDVGLRFVLEKPER